MPLATFNNISVISRRPVLFVEETVVPGENLPVSYLWGTLKYNDTNKNVNL
jgi:hypothetical protein